MTKSKDAKKNKDSNLRKKRCKVFTKINKDCII